MSSSRDIGASSGPASAARAVDEEMVRAETVTRMKKYDEMDDADALSEMARAKSWRTRYETLYEEHVRAKQSSKAMDPNREAMVRQIVQNLSTLFPETVRAWLTDGDGDADGDGDGDGDADEPTDEQPAKRRRLTATPGRSLAAAAPPSASRVPGSASSAPSAPLEIVLEHEGDDEDEDEEEHEAARAVSKPRAGGRGRKRSAAPGRICTFCHNGGHNIRNCPKMPAEVKTEYERYRDGLSASLSQGAKTKLMREKAKALRINWLKEGMAAPIDGASSVTERQKRHAPEVEGDSSEEEGGDGDSVASPGAVEEESMS